MSGNSSSQHIAGFNLNSNPTKKPNFTFNVNILKGVSSTCPKWVLDCYKSPCLSLSCVVLT